MTAPTVAPWTPELAQSQDEPRPVPLAGYMPISHFAYIEVDSLEDVERYGREGMLLCKGRVGWYLVEML